MVVSQFEIIRSSSPLLQKNVKHHILPTTNLRLVIFRGREMKPIPYVFYSYSINVDDQELGDFSHLKVFKAVQKTKIAFRKNDPSESEKDTMLVSLKDRNINKRQVISFFISRRIAERKIKVYDDNMDILKDSFENTSDYAAALVVAIPSMKKMAVADKTGDHDIGSRSAMGRLSNIIKILDKHKFLYEYAATEKDVRQAFKVWSIHQINFSARPFNPHPAVPGLELSDLMKANSAKISSGKITGLDNKPLKNMNDGIINEVLGLGAKGYSQYGAAGTTKEGFNASIAKVERHEDVNTPRKIRIYMPERLTLEPHIEDIVDTMEQIYG